MDSQTWGPSEHRPKAVSGYLHRRYETPNCKNPDATLPSPYRDPCYNCRCSPFKALYEGALEGRLHKTQQTSPGWYPLGLRICAYFSRKAALKVGDGVNRGVRVGFPGCLFVPGFLRRSEGNNASSRVLPLQKSYSYSRPWDSHLASAHFLAGTFRVPSVHGSFSFNRQFVNQGRHARIIFGTS